jgi:hypothetical protein
MKKAYKLIKKRKNGTLGPLFINAKQIIPIGEWLPAENHPTKGFAVRPGWHCTAEPVAPHLKPKLSNGQERVWCEVLIKDFESWPRPEHQGKEWFLAKQMKVVKVLG